MKSIKEYTKIYLDELKEDRVDYTSYRSSTGTMTRGFELVFSALIVIMLLMGNVFEKEVLIPFYSSMTFLLFILVFCWLAIKIFGTISIKRRDMTLGLRHDIIKLFTYMIVFFMLYAGFTLLLGNGATVQPDAVDTMFKGMSNLATVLNWLFGFATISIAFRGIVLIALFNNKKEEFVCDPDVVKEEIKEE